MLLSPDAVVHTLIGNCFVADLTDRIAPSFGFCWDGEKVTINRFMVESAQRTQPVEIELDDETHIFCDQDSKILELNGKKAVPLELNSGTSLLPLYFKLSGGYTLYREPGNWFKGGNASSDKKRWRRVARMVAEWKLGRRLKEGERILCLDDDKTNSHPGNIEISAKLRKRTKKVKNFADPILEAEEFIREVENNPKLGLKLPRRPKNHKIIRASIAVSRDLFSIKTFDSGNLSVSGVFLSE